MSEDQISADPTLLLVTGRKNFGKKDVVRRLANAISKVFEKHKEVKLRCVGAAAVKNAEEAFIIARNNALQDGVNLVSTSDFVNVDFDGMEKVGIVKTIYECYQSGSTG